MDKKIKTQIVYKGLREYPHISFDDILSIAKNMGEEISGQDVMMLYDLIKTKHITLLRQTVQSKLDSISAQETNEVEQADVIGLINSINKLISFFRLNLDDLLLYDIKNDNKTIIAISKAWHNDGCEGFESMQIKVVLEKKDDWKFTVGTLPWGCESESEQIIKNTELSLNNICHLD